MKTKVLVLIFAIISILTIQSAFAAWTWSPFMMITENYFHPLEQGNTTRHDITLQMSQSFNTCDTSPTNGGLALINSELIGEDQFDVLSSIVIAAWIANKPIAILFEGCDGNRARVYGLRIGE